MSEERASQFNKSNYHKHHAVLPYIITPLIFVAIALLIALPVGRAALNYAVNTVHKAQAQLTKDFNDIQPDAVENEDNTSLDNVSIAAGQKLGRIYCDSAGLNTDVYCGLNRVSLRQGVGLKVDAALPGSGKTVKLAGYRTVALKSIGYVKKGDIITFEAMWGSFDYEVYDIRVQSKPDDKQGDLIISTTVDTKPFSSYSDEQLFVYASPVSEEVAQ